MKFGGVGSDEVRSVPEHEAGVYKERRGEVRDREDEETKWSRERRTNLQLHQRFAVRLRIYATRVSVRSRSKREEARPVRGDPCRPEQRKKEISSGSKDASRSRELKLT